MLKSTIAALQLNWFSVSPGSWRAHKGHCTSLLNCKLISSWGWLDITNVPIAFDKAVPKLVWTPDFPVFCAECFSCDLSKWLNCTRFCAAQYVCAAALAGSRQLRGIQPNRMDRKQMPSYCTLSTPSVFSCGTTRMWVNRSLGKPQPSLCLKAVTSWWRSLEKCSKEISLNCSGVTCFGKQWVKLFSSGSCITHNLRIYKGLSYCWVFNSFTTKLTLEIS